MSHHLFALLTKEFEPTKEIPELKQFLEGGIYVLHFKDQNKDEILESFQKKKEAAEGVIEVGEETPKKTKSRKTGIAWVNIKKRYSDSSSTYNSHIEFNLEELLEHFDMLDPEEGEQRYDAFTRQLAQAHKDKKKALADTMQPKALAGLMTGDELRREKKPLLSNKEKPETEKSPEEPVTEPSSNTGVIDPRAAKVQAGAIRNSLHAHRRALEELSADAENIHNEIKGRLEEKMELLTGHAASLQNYLKKIETALQTVNLYLGRDEEITIIRRGKRASAETPIHIRQMVLHMDEEMAVNKPEGIDFQNIDEFDEWLLMPGNLDIVLPDEKGIVVLKPRRKGKHYDDNPMVNAVVNKENFKSYWLLRNGENLYRIYTGHEVGSLLIPRADEISRHFYQESPTGEQKPLRPGTKEYYSSMERAEGVSLQSMQTALMLQGILDRTLIFAPYPDGLKPNLLDPASYGRTLEIIRDAENTLGDGRPTYSEWIEEQNKTLGEGDRIVGDLPHFCDDNGEKTYRNDGVSRVYPENADGYNEDTIHIVQKDSKGLKINFVRTDYVFRRSPFQRSGDAKKRGTYRIYPTDKFFVNIDRITLEEIEHYIHDRKSRSDYMDMMRTLKKARELKLKEESEEKPFIDLLEREIRKIEIPELPLTQELLSDLILEWKIRNKTREPLLPKQNLAFQAILRNYKNLSKEQSLGSAQELERFLQKEKENPLLLRISQTLDGTLDIIVRARPLSLFVHLLQTKAEKNGTFAKPVLKKEWTSYPSVRKRAIKILFENPEGHKLPGKIPGSHIAGEPIKEIIAEFKERSRIAAEKQEEGQNKTQASSLKLIAVTQTGDVFQAIYLSGKDYYAESRYFSLNERVAIQTNTGKTPTISSSSRWEASSLHVEEANTWSWSRTIPGEGFDTMHGDRKKIPANACVVPFPLPEDKPIQHGCHTFYGKNPKRHKIIHFDQDVFKEMCALFQTFLNREKRKEKQRKTISKKIEQFDELARKTWEQKERKIYLEQGGDLRYWNDHLKTIPKCEGVRQVQNEIEHCLSGLVRKYGTDYLRDIKTLRQLLRDTDQLDPKFTDKDFHGRNTNFSEGNKKIREELPHLLDLQINEKTNKKETKDPDNDE